MTSTPPSRPPDTPARPHWSRHVVRVLVVAALIAVFAYLYSKGAR